MKKNLFDSKYFLDDFLSLKRGVLKWLKERLKNCDARLDEFLLLEFEKECVMYLEALRFLTSVNCLVNSLKINNDILFFGFVFFSSNFHI